MWKIRGFEIRSPDAELTDHRITVRGKGGNCGS